MMHFTFDDLKAICNLYMSEELIELNTDNIHHGTAGQLFTKINDMSRTKLNLSPPRPPTPPSIPFTEMLVLLF